MNNVATAAVGVDDPFERSLPAPDASVNILPAGADTMSTCRRRPGRRPH